jgi:Flp pilus assembly protein TadG
MQRRQVVVSSGRSHPGKTLVMFALVLPVLLGIVGLVIDCGILMAAQRQAQNAADAAAMAAAMADLVRQGAPQDSAAAIVNTSSGLSRATLSAFNHPPTAGAHAGNIRYYEAIVTYPVNTLFMSALGAPGSQSAQARAVAGYESVRADAAIALLDPRATPGLSVRDQASLVVGGRIVVNSLADPAAVVTGGTVQAADYHIVGPSTSGNFQPYPGTSGQVVVNSPPAPDPLLNLPVPATTPSAASNTATPLGNAWNPSPLGSPSVQDGQASGLVDPNHVDDAGVVQLFPGVYQSITISGGTLNFNPGVYVLSPSNGPQFALDVTGGTVTGTGILFYNTGADFVPATGSPDSGDPDRYNPGPAGTGAPSSSADFQGNFAAIRIDSSQGAQITLTPLSAVGDSFSGMLLYQRRPNMQPITIVGGNLSLSGTIYAPWAPLMVAGGGNYQAQFVAGSMQLSGNERVTLDYAREAGSANEVFLVE